MKPWIAALLTLLASPAVAQQHHQHGHSPHAGLEQREIKALSNEQIAELRVGRGMGLALAAGSMDISALCTFLTWLTNCN